VKASHEYASSIMNSVWTGEPSVIYGNLRNNGCITSLPDNCAAEVPCLVDASGIQPTHVGALPPQLTALMRTNINVQELTVAALMAENREHLYHAAMMDPHTDLVAGRRPSRRPSRLDSRMGARRPQDQGGVTLSLSPPAGPRAPRAGGLFS
jgi:hypothetical protein